MRFKILLALILFFIFVLFIPNRTNNTNAAENQERISDSTSVYFPLIVSHYINVNTSEMAFIPAGEFWFGCDTEHNGGFPCHSITLPLQKIYLDEFFIDKTEVTNFQYSQCVSSGVCDPPDFYNSSTRDSYYNNPLYAIYPVIYVNWSDADIFCQWAGKHLPLEDEWEKAARGSEDSRAYPWGDEDPNCGLANSYNNATLKHCVGDTVEVGSYPAGASPYGVLDMSGNVMEWVKGLSRSDFTKNGSFKYGWPTLLVAERWPTSGWQPSSSRGFRCAYTP